MFYCVNIVGMNLICYIVFRRRVMAAMVIGMLFNLIARPQDCKIRLAEIWKRFIND
jgi:hypothetical protein